MPEKPHETPSEVTAEEGQVMVDGPDGVAVSMTPDAAEQTSDRLLDGAGEARRQRNAAREAREGEAGTRSSTSDGADGCEGLPGA